MIDRSFLCRISSVRSIRRKTFTVNSIPTFAASQSVSDDIQYMNQQLITDIILRVISIWKNEGSQSARGRNLSSAVKRDDMENLYRI